MKKLIILIGMVLLATSCITQKKCLERYPYANQVDTTYIEKLKEIPVYIPGDTIKLSSPVNCPDQDLIKVENSKLKQEISIIKGKLVSNTTIKPDTIIKYVPEIHESIHEVKVPQPVKIVPPIYKDALWICIIEIIAFAAWLGFKIKKSFFK